MKNLFKTNLTNLPTEFQEEIGAAFVELSGDFDEGSAKEFRKNFREQEAKAITLGQEVLPVIIDSYGGQVYSLLSMVDVINACPLKVATIVEGKAMSCGAILFSCGHEGLRFVGPSATVLIHDVSSGAWGKEQDLEVSSKEAKRLNKFVYKLMAKNCGHHKSYFYDLITKIRGADLYLSPKDCVKHNLANHIRIPEFTTELSLRHSFK